MRRLGLQQGLAIGTVLVAVLGFAWVATRAGEHVLMDIDGVAHGSLERPARGKWPALFFLTPDCPIANQYAPEIGRICDSYRSKGVECFLVYADPTLTADDVREHTRDYHASRYPAILDSHYVLVEKAGATVSSEVAVFSAGAALEYRGRIDNFNVALGVPRQRATQHDLREALDALVAARSVPNARTEAVGCFLPAKDIGARS
jgi:hypothetical protein